LTDSRKLFNILMPAQKALFWNTKHWQLISDDGAYSLY